MGKNGELTFRCSNPNGAPIILLQNYISHLSVFRTGSCEKVGGLKGIEGSQDYDLVLRFVEQTSLSESNTFLTCSITARHSRLHRVAFRSKKLRDEMRAGVAGTFLCALGKRLKSLKGFRGYHRIVHSLPTRRRSSA